MGVGVNGRPPRETQDHRRGPVQHLDGHRAIKPRVAAAINLAHATSAERRDDLLRAEAHAAGQGHRATPIPA